MRNAEAFYNKELYFKQKVNDKIENLKKEENKEKLKKEKKKGLNLRKRKILKY